MKLTHFFSLFFLFCLTAASLADNTQDVSNPDLTKASWIWAYPDAHQKGGMDAYFRFKFRPEQPIKEATLLITADNCYELYVNSRMIAEEAGAGTDVWGTVERYRIEDNLVSQAVNCIAVRVESLGGNACGLLVAAKIVYEDGEIQEIYSDATWLSTEEPGENWWAPDHGDSQWHAASILVPYGQGPWGTRLTVAQTVTDPATLKVERGGGHHWARRPDLFHPPGDDFVWLEGIVYLEGRAPDNSEPLAETNFRMAGTAAYWENDVPAPTLSGSKMITLIPASPQGTPTTILDAGKGWIGSPVTSYDGKTIFFCMALEGETFYHLYSIGIDGSNLKQLTSGKWHDLDPCELPDGSLVFSSTRTAARDEYHANIARSLFRLDLETGVIRPITYHITADAKPKVMADGRIAFIRHDNFLERAKVETHVHCVRPDGTAGEILIGPDRGAIGYDLATAAEHDGAWLRNFGFGCPTPLPDGRIAALSHSGAVISKTQESISGETSEEPVAVPEPERRGPVLEKPIPVTIEPMPCNISLLDMAPLPDNRILATTSRRTIAIVDPATGRSYRIIQSTEPVHSPAFLGARPKPRIWPDLTEPAFPTSSETTGYLYCGNVFYTKQTEAEWDRVRAVRIYVGQPLTLRSARHQYGHIGTVGIDLGTFPIMPNGSFSVEVPADMPLAIQAVDAEGRAVVNELSWIYTRPGEFRSCIGCHADRNVTPEFAATPTGQRRPIDLTVGIDTPKFRANNGANGGVLNLQLERMRETIGIDLYPEAATLANVDAPPGVRPVIQYLVHEMQTAKRAGERYAAIQRLGILRPQGIAPELCNVMRKDENDEVRMLAAMTLATCATHESVPMLIEALSDSFEQVGHAAHITLEHMTNNGDAREVPPRDRQAYWQTWFRENTPDTIEAQNAQVLDAPDWTDSAESIQFRKAVEALAHYGKSDAVKESLRTVLAEQPAMDTLSKITVIRTLGILQDEKSVPLLTQILVDCCLKKRPPARGSHEFGWTAMPDHIGGAAAEALGRIQTQEALDGLVKGFETLEEFWFYTFRTADHDWLMGSVSAIIHFRILEALETIGTCTSLDVRTPIRSLADKILRSVPIDSDRGILLDNDDYEKLVGRMMALADYSGDYIEACLAVLEGKQGDEIKMKTVSASPPAVSTGILEPTSRAAQIIAVLVQEQTSAEHRERIRNAFETFRSREASRERSWTCYMLARALGRLQDKESIPFLLSALNDEKREFDFGSPLAPNIFLTNAMTPVHRASAAAALGMIGDPVALPTLLAVAEDFHNMMDVRDAAASAMLDIGRKMDPQAVSEHKDFVGRLKTVAETYPELYPGKTLFRAYRVWAEKGML